MFYIGKKEYGSWGGFFKMSDNVVKAILSSWLHEIQLYPSY